MNAKAVQKERTHGEILESAGRILRGRGIAGMVVSDVMKAAGLTVGGFYAHFANKDALVDATLHLAATEQRERLFTGLREKPAAERIESLLRRYLSAVHRDDVERGCTLPAVVGEISTTAQGQRPVLETELLAFADEVEALMPAESTLPRRTRALGLLALMYGGLSMARALRGTDLSDEILRACRAFGRAAIQGFSSQT